MGCWDVSTGKEADEGTPALTSQDLERPYRNPGPVTLERAACQDSIAIAYHTVIYTARVVWRNVPQGRRRARFGGANPTSKSNPTIDYRLHSVYTSVYPLRLTGDINTAATIRQLSFSDITNRNDSNRYHQIHNWRCGGLSRDIEMNDANVKARSWSTNQVAYS